MIRALRSYIAKRRAAGLERQREAAKRAYLEALHKKDTRSQHARWKAYSRLTALALKVEAQS